MAKKQSLSYGPNMGLIAGEAQVAKSEAGLSNSVGAFTQGFIGVFGAIKKDEEEQAAKMEAYSAQVPSLDQIHFMKDESNKQVVRTFLNKQRDEYSRLAEIFDKTKDRDVKDKMEAIKFSLVNLNDQIKVFNQDKADYITAFDEGQIAKGKAQPNGAYFTDIYTNNSRFGVGDNGDLSFTVGGQTSLFKDRAGTWNPRNNISETFFLDNFQREIGNAQKGGKFIESTTYNRLFNNLRSTGNDGLQALITQDLVGDRTNNTFEQQFASGTLDTKIYAGYENYKLDKSDPRFKEGEYEYDTDFMFKNENGDKVRGLVAQYFTNVTRTGHENEFLAKTDGDGDGDDGKYFKLNQNFGGGITGGVLNKLINDLDTGTININGKEYNVNPNNNSWSSKDGDVKSGNDVLQHYYDTFGSDFAFYNDVRFSKYRGTKTKEEEIVTSATIEDVESNIKEFFVDLEMLDADGNYIPFEASGVDKFLGGGDIRMGKNRVGLKEKINNFLIQAGVENMKASTSIASPNSITFNGKKYTFKQGEFENNYNNLIKDLSNILKKGDVSQINFG